MGFFRDVFSGIAGPVGTMVGGYFGGPTGAMAGGALGGTVGGAIGAPTADKQYWERTHHQARLQESFAKNSIQWKAEDARKAGIHPLAAMGVNTMSPSPTSVGSMGSFENDMGQDISRAMMATMDKDKRIATKIQLEGAQLDNDIKRAELASAIARAKAQQNPPLEQPRPLERTASPKGRRDIEGATISTTGFSNTGSGLRPVPSKDNKERIEDDFLQQTLWALDAYTGGQKPTLKQLRKDFPHADGSRYRWGEHKPYSNQEEYERYKKRPRHKYYKKWRNKRKQK